MTCLLCPTFGPSILKRLIAHESQISQRHLPVTDKHYSFKQIQNLAPREDGSGIFLSALNILFFLLLSVSFPLTSWQTDGSAAFPLGKVVRADVNLLLAQPPEAEVGCLAGLVDFGHPRAEHSPVVRYHRCEHASHTHQQYEDGYVYLCALVHVSR